mgnify:CR=1 FL=1
MRPAPAPRSSHAPPRPARSRSARRNSLKDAEWVEKKADALKKTLRGATGTANLRDKALKEEYVRPSSLSFRPARRARR